MPTKARAGLRVRANVTTTRHVIVSDIIMATVDLEFVVVYTRILGVDTMRQNMHSDPG